MNDYLTSPVTPIVAAVVAVAGFTAIIIKIVSNRRKEQAQEEARRMHEKVQRQLIDELRSKPKPRPRLRRPSVHAPGRPGFRTDAPPRSAYDPYDPTIMLTTGFIASSDPGPNSSNCDTSSSSSYDSGSSGSSSSDSGSSCGSDGGGGGGGGD
jgi:uncharacterized membrane protein YgcG